MIESDNLREALIGRLTEEGIQFQLDDSGAVCYSLNDESSVDSYIREAASASVFPRTRLQIPGRAYTIAVMRALESEQIEFRSAEIGSEIVVTLERDADVEEAYAIIRRVGREQFDIEIK